MKVRELLDGRQILTVKPDDSLATAAQLMAWANVRHLPVLRDAELIGVLSERDVLRYTAAEGEQGRADLVERAMSSPPLTAHPEDDVIEVEERMLSEKLGCLPIVEKGRLIGLLTTIDLLENHVREQAGGPAPIWNASSIMTRNPEAVRPEDNLLGAILRMADRQVRHLPVVDEGRRVVGMLSDRDVRARVGSLRKLGDNARVESETSALKVKDAMSRAVTTIDASTPLSKVVNLLLDRRIGAIPVVDAGERLAGVISYLDVVRALRDQAPQ